MNEILQEIYDYAFVKHVSLLFSIVHQFARVYDSIMALHSWHFQTTEEVRPAGPFTKMTLINR